MMMYLEKYIQIFLSQIIIKYTAQEISRRFNSHRVGQK